MRPYLPIGVAATLLAGCAPAYPGGQVRNAADAATLAKHKCGADLASLDGPWHATLAGPIWSIALDDQTGRSIVVTVDARTGATGNCRLKPS